MSNGSGTQINPKHTPGPWVFDYRLGVVSYGERTVKGEPIQIALEVRNTDGDIIAAAPDLYEALEGMIKALRAQTALAKQFGGDLAVNDSNGDAWEKAKSALAKARGEK